MTSSKSNHQNNNPEKPSWVLGYTTKKHLLLDLDNTSFYKVVALTKMIIEQYPEVGHCLIMQTSTPKKTEHVIYSPATGTRVSVDSHHFHLIFNNYIGYDHCCSIIETLAELDTLNKDYMKIRELRSDMTLRTNKIILQIRTKPQPIWIAFIKNKYTEKEGKGIQTYLNFYLVTNRL